MITTTVAVIIPTLNEERFIGKCLESVLAQSFPIERMDIMVIDGGSRDRTKEIVYSYEQYFPHLRFIHNPKMIQAAAFNIGVQCSDAPYIIRLDAHALYDREYIRKCIKHLQTNRTLGNVGGVWDIQAQNNTLQAKANAIANQVKFGIGGAAFRVGAEAGETDTVPFGAFPRRVLEKVGLMREDLPRGEDNEINSRIRKNGYKIWLDPTIISTYFARPNIAQSTKQMYYNGVSIGWLMHIDRKSLGLRHLVPMCFVLTLVGSLLLACFIPSLWWIFTSIIGLYLLVAFIASFIACRKFGFRYFFILPALFFCMHFAYGWGTMVGICQKL